MKQLAFIVALSAPLFFSAPTSALDAAPPPPHPINPADHGMNNDFFISSDELARLEHLALAGDGESANKVSDYFEFYEYDGKQGKYWTQISAENGNPAGQRNLATILSTKDADPSESPSAIEQNMERACFWIKKARQNGADAPILYERLKQTCKF